MSNSTLKSKVGCRPQRKRTCVRKIRRVRGEFQKHAHEAISEGRARAKVGECKERLESEDERGRTEGLVGLARRLLLKLT